MKTTTRQTKTGTVRYAQLAHNEWDAAAGVSRRGSCTHFGREDELDRAAVERLIGALSRLLDPAAATAAIAAPGMPELSIASSRPIGGTHLLGRGCGAAGPGRHRAPRCAEPAERPATERILFALVANRALAASSKLAATGWIASDVHIDGLPEVSDDACYRAMDRLPAIEPTVAEQAYFQVTDLLNLEVDLLFFDYPANQVRDLALAA